MSSFCTGVFPDAGDRAKHTTKMIFKTRFRFIWLMLAVAITSLFSACGEKAKSNEEILQTSDEIFQERVNLPALYFTAKTHRRVEAPISKGPHVDKGSKEICWPAFACQNPNCPSKGNAGEPFLFIVVDPTFVIKTDGTIGIDQSKMTKNETLGACPECLKKRNLRSESKKDKQRYANWVRPHVLPETAKRMKELNEEGKRNSNQNK